MTTEDRMISEMRAFPDSALSVATSYVAALLENNLERARAFSTPERPWRTEDLKFDAFHFQHLHAENQFGIGNQIESPEGFPEIAYVKLIHGVTQAEVLPAGHTAQAHYVTLVHRPDLGGWLVHHFGDDKLSPEELPRS